MEADPVVLALLGVISMPFLVACVVAPPAKALFVLLAARSWTDWAVLPDGVQVLFNTVLGLLAVGVAVRQRARLRRSIGPAVVLTASLLFFVGVALYNYGLRSELIGEIPRVFSLAAIFTIATAVVQQDGALTLVKIVRLAVAPSALLAIAQLVAPALGTGTGRSAGSFVHPNAAVVAFNACLLLSIYFLLQFGFNRRDLLFAVLYFAASTSTLSLGGLAGLFAGAVVLIAIRSGGKRYRRHLLAVLATAAAFYLLAMSPVSARMDEFGSDELTVEAAGADANSLQWRLRNWLLYVDYWKESPVIGHGWGVTDDILTPLGKQPHSEPIRLLVEVGLVGTAVCAIWLALVARRLVEAARLEIEFSGLLVALSVAVGIHASEANMMRSTAAMWVVLTLYALVDPEARRTRLKDARARFSHQLEAAKL